MADEQDLLVKIEDDEAAPPPPAPAPEPEQKAQESGTPPQPDPATELKAQYEELQAREAKRAEELDAARAREEEIRRTNETLRREHAQGQVQVIDAQVEGAMNSLQAAEKEVAAAKAELAAALERADYAAVAEAQQHLTDAVSDIRDHGRAKEYWQNQKKAAEAPPPQRQQPTNDVDAFIERLNGPSRDWARSHRDIIADPVKRRKMELAHAHAIGEELTPDTPEYFAHIEERLGLRDGGKVEPPKPATPKRSVAPPTAPVSGGGNGHSAVAGEPVVLTKGEARAATDGTLVWNYPDPSGKNRWKKGEPIGIQEMARRKREGMKAGLYHKTYTEQ